MTGVNLNCYTNRELVNTTSSFNNKKIQGGVCCRKEGRLSSRRKNGIPSRTSILQILLLTVSLPQLYGAEILPCPCRSLQSKRIGRDLANNIRLAPNLLQKRRNYTLHAAPFTIPRGGGGGERGGGAPSAAGALQKRGKGVKEEEEHHKTSPRLLLMIKILFITYYGSLGALMPYLPVYYHSLGHSGQSIGLLGAVKPLTTFFVAPLWGIISDYTENPSLILQLTFIMSMGLQLLLPLKDNVNYLVTMVFLTALFNAPVKSLIDSMVMDKLDENSRGQYGKLRLYGQLGFGIGSSIVGTLIGRSTAPTAQSPLASPSPAAEKIIMGAMEVGIEASAAAAASEEITKTAIETLSELVSSSIEKLSRVTGYKLAFVAYGFLSIPAFICMKTFRRLDANESVQIQKKKKKVAKKATVVPKGSSGARIRQGIAMLLHSSDAMVFFFLVFLVGTTSGIIENFAYVRIREVGGTGKEMGICRLTSSMAGAPMFWFSGPLTEKLGADRVLVLSLVSYILRFLIYALLRNPYQALPAEALRGVTFAAFWSTGTVFAHKISPPGMSATMLLFMNAMYGGLGQSVGAILGGKLQSRVGTKMTFLCAAFVDFIFVCFITAYLSVRKESSFRNPKQITLPNEKSE
uniref:Major facilitator superfamily (MFS) profile domain-containing protein n=1 Tax=Chaetoceros debilis TaxID=122233 RepID=A0A7S3VB90_9STRA